MRPPTRLPHPHRRPATAAGIAAFALVALVAVVLAAGRTAGQPARSVGATTVEGLVRIGPNPGLALADAYRPVDAARRSPTVPAAVLAAAVIVTGLALAGRFVPPPGPVVRSSTGRRAGGDRGPPLPAV